MKQSDKKTSTNTGIIFISIILLKNMLDFLGIQDQAAKFGFRSHDLLKLYHMARSSLKLRKLCNNQTVKRSML